MADTLEERRVTLAATPDGGFTLPGPFPGGGFPVSLLFGNTDDARACHSAYLEASSVGVTAAQRLGATLSSDEGRLHQVISCFQQTDHDAADQICAAAGDTLNVFTTHVHSGSRGELGGDDDERADQINTAVDALAENPGPTVFTGDLNIDYDSSRERDGVLERNTESAAAVARLEDELGFANAGDAAGPTSNYGEGDQIDYVFTSPDLTPDSDNAQKVEGDPEGNQDLSDHDGIAVDIDIPPRW
ncbi:MAG: endonuclease/exonuclease/phosphatase family protein [Pseudonocardiaceae bacterium]